MLITEISLHQPVPFIHAITEATGFGANKKGMVTHPRVLTQRTPVLRSGDLLSLLLSALFRAALFRAALLGAAFLCSCHTYVLLIVKILPGTQDNVALLLLCTSVNVIQHIVVYNLLRVFLSTFFFVNKQNETTIYDSNRESGCQSRFHACRLCARLTRASIATAAHCDSSETNLQKATTM